MKTCVFSKKAFIEEMLTNNISDKTVEDSNEFYICIDSTGGPESEPFFKSYHPNVFHTVFDDSDKDEVKWGADIQGYYSAVAMTKPQAVDLVRFIRSIPTESIVNIHCAKGKSRSIAVESFIQGTKLGNQHVLKLLEEAWTGK